VIVIVRRCVYTRMCFLVQFTILSTFYPVEGQLPSRNEHIDAEDASCRLLLWLRMLLLKSFSS